MRSWRLADYRRCHDAVCVANNRLVQATVIYSQRWNQSSLQLTATCNTVNRFQWWISVNGSVENRRLMHGYRESHLWYIQVWWYMISLTWQATDIHTLVTAWWNLYSELTTPAFRVWADVAGAITWQLLSVSVTNWQHTDRQTDRQI